MGAGYPVLGGVNAAEVGIEPLTGRVGASLAGKGYSRCRDRARGWAARGGLSRAARGRRGQEPRPGVRAASGRRRRKGRCPEGPQRNSLRTGHWSPDPCWPRAHSWKVLGRCCLRPRVWCWEWQWWQTRRVTQNLQEVSSWLSSSLSPGIGVLNELRVPKFVVFDKNDHVRDVYFSPHKMSGIAQFETSL